MPRRYVLADDFDGKPLSDDTQPIQVSLGRKSWNVYLSDANTKKLYAAIEPFTKDADSTEVTVSRRRGASSSTRRDPEQTKAIREWANQNGHKVSDRGRISAEVVEAYEKSH
jgi:hypothetical protein